MDQSTILIVDDEKDILEEYGSIFDEYPVNILTTSDPQDAIALLSSNDVKVLVTDHKMPGMRGLELVGKAKDISPDTIRIILTGYADQDLILEAINVGHVFQFLVKPCEPEKFISTVLDALDYYKEREKMQKIIDSRETYVDAKSDLEILHTQLREREAEIQMLMDEHERSSSVQQESFKAMFTFLVSIIRIKNNYLFKNGKWVAEFSSEVAKIMGLSEQERNITRMAGYLKNLGLVLLPDLCTEKTIGMFSDEELKQYYRFPAIGEQILKKLPGFNRAAIVIGNQLERYDGSGPRGLCSGDIPLPAQIIGAADDSYKILFARSKDEDRETVYGRTFMINHLRKNLKKLYSVEVAMAAAKVLEKGIKR